MSTLTDLIDKIDNLELRTRISQEVTRLTKQKKFGLVYEEHLPECTPLYDLKVKKGSTVAIKVVDDNGDRKLGSVNDTYTVLGIEGNVARCERHQDKSVIEQPVDNLVVVAQFGMPIYPFLKEIDSICNAPNSKLWHALIEADNFHALQLLVYLYGGMVDCIYIDPPYNSGAKDWKYNNDYVDNSDSYRHSKWLSMMQRRLKIAKQLLNPKDSVLIVTIDEKEYLHLGCLLEEMFPEASIQMISTIINPKGVAASQGFRRADEYVFFVMFGTATPAELALSNEWMPSAIRAGEKKQIKKERVEIGWTSMMRRGSHSSRKERPGLYYAIYADPIEHKIVKVGDVLPNDVHADKEIDGLTQILPIRTNGEEGVWQVGPQELKNRIKQGRIRLGKETAYGFVVNYLADGEYKKILNKEYEVVGKADDGSLLAYAEGDVENKFVAPTQWKLASHDASAYGSSMLQNIFLQKRFSFPKSLYAVHDTIRFFVANKPNALIVDFFSGSGTTLHAVNLLNAEDDGNRRCIMVTNNEISSDEVADFLKNKFKPGDAEWEAKGIARYVTWPRTTCTIKGVDVKGNPLEGKYIDTDIMMSDGFKANAVFYHLGFLDKNAVALGRQFKELVPMLWMKAGAIGECPKLPLNQALPKMMVCPENKFAVLIDELYYKEFVEELSGLSDVETVYIVTDSESGYREMAAHLKVKKSFQLYRDYLDNFRINRAVR